MIQLLEDKNIDDYIIKASDKDSLNVELEYIFGKNEYETKEVLKKDLFIRLLSHCDANYISLNSVNNLDIRTKESNGRTSSNRTSILDLESIKEYCKTDKLTKDMNVEYIKKYKHDKDKKYKNLEYNFRCNLNIEESVKDKLDLEEWNKSLKYFRYKYRKSFITNDKLFRIDLTAVKSNKFIEERHTNREGKSYIKRIYKFYKTFKESKILDEEENYELEIEYVGNMKFNGVLNIGNFIDNNEKSVNIFEDNIYKSGDSIINEANDNKLTKLEIIDGDINEYIEKIDDNILNKIKIQFNQIINELHMFIYDTKLLMKRSEINEVLNGYLKLTGQENQNIKYLKRNPNFKGPQPVTLNFQNLDKNIKGNIFNNYVVTEKADGERYLLYINDKKRGYLINDRFNVKDIGITFASVNDEWLLDGEYIREDKYKRKINLFMIFDVYYANEEYTKPLYTYKFKTNISNGDCRSDILEVFKNHIHKSKNNTGLIIDIKKYMKDINEIGERILHYSKNILLKGGIIKYEDGELLENTDISLNEYEYKIDGLIYLPIDLPVGGNYNNKNIFLTGTWKYNYKWKPEKENTIDFLVNIKQEEVNNKLRDIKVPYIDTIDGKKINKLYKTLILKTVYNEYYDDTLDFCMKILKNENKNENKPRNKKFNPPNTWEDVGETNILFTDIGMLCENNEPIKDGYILEMRYNTNAKNNIKWTPLKVRRDKLKPQGYDVANNIFSTIINPITNDMICGDINKINETIKLSKSFSSTTDDYYIGESNNLESLRKLHNYIKYRLIIGIGGIDASPKKIMDTSIGLGGDIFKYLNNKVNCKFLFGLDYAPVNEACKRFYKEKGKQMYKNSKCVFIRYDTSKNIIDKSGFVEIDNTHSKNMINILYDNNELVDDEYKNINRHSEYKGLASDKFHIISSQFSIHYYFKNENTLNGFLTNISQNIRKGGYFIGTCYDGNYIFERLKDSEPFEYYIGDKKIYSVEKKYDIKNFDFNSDSKTSMLGQIIDVYMESIGQNMPEYLVNFDYFIDKMKEYGFKPHKPKMNSISEKVIQNDIGNFYDIINNLEELEKTDTLLQKPKTDKDKHVGTYKESLNILQNEKLMELSSMNKYFIFQKI